MNNTRKKFLASISMLATSFSFPIDAFSFHKKKEIENSFRWNRNYLYTKYTKQK